MIRDAVVEPRSITFTLESDGDIAAVRKAMNLLSVYGNKTLNFEAPDFSLTHNRRQFDYAFSAGPPATATFSIAADDPYQHFSYEDLKLITGKLAALCTDHDKDIFLEQGRRVLPAYRTLFVPAQEHARFEVEIGMTNEDCHILFNQHHPHYSAESTNAFVRRVSNKFGTQKYNPTPEEGAREFHIQHREIDEADRLAFIAQYLEKFGILTPSESVQFMEDLRAQRLSHIAAEMIGLARTNSRSSPRRIPIDTLETVMTPIAQDGDFLRVPREQLQQLRAITQNPLASFTAAREIVPDGLQLNERFLKMTVNYAREIGAANAEQIRTRTAEHATNLRNAGVITGESDHAHHHPHVDYGALIHPAKNSRVVSGGKDQIL